MIDVYSIHRGPTAYNISNAKKFRNIALSRKLSIITQVAVSKPQKLGLLGVLLILVQTPRSTQG